MQVKKRVSMRTYRQSALVLTDVRRQSAGAYILRGFTLVELLVVIAIISILAGMLMPALENAIGHARQIECAEKLRQFGVATSFYINDSNGWFPQKGDFANATESRGKLWDFQLGNTYLCYDWVDSGPDLFHCPNGTYQDIMIPYPWRSRGYWMNSYIYTNYSLSNITPMGEISNVPSPSQLGYMLELSYDGKYELSTRFSIANPNVFYGSSISDPDMGWRHSDMMNVLYGDSHVKVAHKGMPSVNGWSPADTIYYWQNGSPVTR